MASSTSSLPRASPQESPSNSMQKPDTTIETLIAYLVASKRSLASIHLVQRATTILSEARSAVESTTILAARATYLRRSLASQLKILRGVQFELDTSAQALQVEFKAVLKELDATDRRLQASVEILKTTRVEDGFRNASAFEEKGDEGTDLKETLHDFVDSQNVEVFKDGIKNSIDEVQQAQQEMDSAIDMFEKDLQVVSDALSDKTGSLSLTRSDLHQPDVAGLLRTLEDHAKEMAESLESLVSHFDLCVTAIKHTEGGGAAVAQNVKAEDLPDGVGVEDFEAPAQSMGEDERTEMMQVLETDAAEVDDVVIEIQDRNAEMEVKLDQIMLWKEKKEAAYDDVVVAFKLLDTIGSRLSGHIAEKSRFANKWAEERIKIEDGMAGLDELRGIYGNFAYAYDGLIVEVVRRKSVKRQMEKVANEAQIRLHKLYEADKAERDIFHAEQGPNLPSEIWHGITAPPPKFAVSRLDVNDSSVPDLPRKTVEDALKRLKANAARD